MEMLVECKQMRRHVLALAMGISVLSSSLAQVQSSTESLIHVEVAGLRSNKGEVLCSLFSSASDFPRRPQKGVAPAKGDISDHHAVCEFVGIPPGTYAVSLFHDENSNGKLDTKDSPQNNLNNFTDLVFSFSAGSCSSIRREIRVVQY
jgi:uncharacterized protein (DUF2141 family)